MIRASEIPGAIDTAPMAFACGMSRSGTTLLATILDSHSRISMGYELIPPPLPGPAALREALERGLALSAGEFGRSGQELRAAGDREAGLFLTRCHRAGLDAAATREALLDLEREGLREISGLRDRLRVAWRLARARREAERTDLFGFKMNIPSLEKARELFPGGRFIYILRDPRDVVASHRQRGFDRTLEEVCEAWCGYLDAFERLQDAHPGSAHLVRYEDLVSEPRPALEAIFRTLGVPLEESVVEFHSSKAAVHRSSHPNAERLQGGFSTSSLGRFRRDLSPEDIREIEGLCGERLARRGYR